jgi:hypothetical protein
MNPVLQHAKALLPTSFKKKFSTSRCSISLFQAARWLPTLLQMRSALA